MKAVLERDWFSIKYILGSNAWIFFCEYCKYCVVIESTIIQVEYNLFVLRLWILYGGKEMGDTISISSKSIVSVQLKKNQINVDEDLGKNLSKTILIRKIKTSLIIILRSRFQRKTSLKLERWNLLDLIYDYKLRAAK